MRMQSMRFGFWLLLASIFMGASVAPARAADGDAYLGTWAGTWMGQDGSSGHFLLTLQRAGDGNLGGSIAVVQDGGGASDYTAPLKHAGFTGDKFTAAYEPPDGQSEITLKGTFTTQSGDGNWALNAKGQPTAAPIASGTWKILKN